MTEFPFSLINLPDRITPRTFMTEERSREIDAYLGTLPRGSLEASIIAELLSDIVQHRLAIAELAALADEVMPSIREALEAIAADAERDGTNHSALSTQHPELP